MGQNSQVEHAQLTSCPLIGPTPSVLWDTTVARIFRSSRSYGPGVRTPERLPAQQPIYAPLR
ncbi:unnamed protein product [[Actinomadura] parvosata subsp. kistnae]|nr:unnamed protein product [Actinomadura parvosata subsp. kistnae]